MRKGRKRTFLCFALLLLLVVSAADGLAAPGLEPVAAARPQGAAEWAEMPAIPWGRLLWGTALVAGLICVGVYALKRLNGGFPLNRGRYMELLETRPVGRKVQLFLVRVGRRAVLLASSGSNVTRVAEFADEELPEPEAVRGQGGLCTFASFFRKRAGAQR